MAPDDTSTATPNGSDETRRVLSCKSHRPKVTVTCDRQGKQNGLNAPALHLLFSQVEIWWRIQIVVQLNPDMSIWAP